MTAPAPSVSAPQVVLDAKALAALRELDPSGQGGLIARIMATFDNSLVRMLAQVDEAAARDDWATINHVAHTLKSSSASVGALELARRSLEIEKLLRDKRQADVSPLLPAWVEEMQRARAAVRALGDAPA